MKFAFKKRCKIIQFVVAEIELQCRPPHKPFSAVLPLFVRQCETEWYQRWVPDRWQSFALLVPKDWLPKIKFITHKWKVWGKRTCTWSVHLVAFGPDDSSWEVSCPSVLKACPAVLNISPTLWVFDPLIFRSSLY